MSIGYLECFSGISGDMLLGALVDAGVSFQHLEETAAALGVGACLQMRKVSRGGLAATKVDVITPDTPAVEPEDSHHDHPGHTHAGDERQAYPHQEHSHQAHSQEHSHTPHRALSSILEIIRSAPLSDAVKARATRAFQLLGEAEAAIHSIPVEEVHFHEVGAVDTIVDIVCAAAGAEALDRELGIVRWLASPLNVGSGTVVCQHGRLPVPATLALLGGAPVYAAGPPMERVTPTGAVLLRMLDVRYEPLPPMRIVKTGYGAGGRQTPGEPNLLRLLVGEEETAGSVATDAIAVIETVIDDCNPQLLAYVSEKLLEAGAWDVYRAAVQMKKGRTGVQMTTLCRPDLVSALRDLLFRETTTIGLRWRLENKIALAREFVEAETKWGKVRIKVARLPGGEQANAAPEYEDCRRLAIEHAVPLKQVMEEAMRAYVAAK
jgi:uncharacterized protein (TIGR00299 family) protein